MLTPQFQTLYLVNLLICRVVGVYFGLNFYIAYSILELIIYPRLTPTHSVTQTDPQLTT